MAVNRQHGFTLAELMVVVAIIGILAATTAPLGMNWVNRAKVKSVEGDLREVFAKAKSVALRNAHMATDQQPVTAVCLSETNSLSLVTRTSTEGPSCATGQGELLWSTVLNDNVSISSNGNPLSCICFDRSGLPTTVDCSGCNTATSLQFDAGSKTGTLLVQ